MQTVQNRKEYQGIGAIEAFEYENARSDFVATTDKNEKTICQTTYSYVFQGPKGHFPLYWWFY